MSGRVPDGDRGVLRELRDGFANPAAPARPMVRWWWFGPQVERAEIERELDAMAAAGFGGAELAVVYPLSSTTSSFLSPEFLGDVRFTAEAARARGLRFDLTLGSGWSFGGPHIGPETAARTLHWERREVLPEAVSFPVPVGWPGDEFVAAYVGPGSLQEPPARLEPLAIVDGRVVIPVGAGPRVVLTAVSRLTGQNVKRSAAGAEGPVFDHYSRAATDAHIVAVCEPLLTAAGGELVGSVFCDSLEVYGADWTPGALDEFRRRRGYDPSPELYLLEIDGPDAPRLRRDMYRTLTELAEENFVAPLQRWASGHGVPFRIQAYGEPPLGVSSYRFADLIEGEGWGWKEVTQTRWASSAAHLHGRPVVSSEIWTWVHSPSFRATPLDLKAEAHEHLLLGINQFIGHGWPYSPSGLPGIGWMFYASGALDDRNPWWPAMPELTAYLHRLCWLMRQGAPATSVALYAPTSDAYAAMHAGGHGVLDLWRATRTRIGDDVPRIIREAGLDFDLIDDDALAVVDAGRYPVVVLPGVVHLTEVARRWLADVERVGGRVVAVETDPRGSHAVPVAGLAAVLLGVAPPPAELSPHSPDVGIVHRTLGGIDIYFLANTAGDDRVVEVTFARPGTVERWDAATGRACAIGRSAAAVPIRLAAYEATVLVVSDDDTGLESAADGERAGRRLPLDGGWTVLFADGGDPAPVTLPHRWEDAPTRTGYSGSATYTTTIELDGPAPRARLDLGPTAPSDAGPAAEAGIRGRSFRAEVRTPIGDVAVVSVNGRRVGVLWSTPYAIEIGDHLVAGVNSIELTVFNTAANALAVDPTVGETAEASAERFGRRFRMQELDRAAEGVASGLLATPTLVV
jgi:hypothetical protein